MNYNEYKEIIAKTPVTEGLLYKPTVLWLNVSRFPVGLYSLNGCTDTFIRMPDRLVDAEEPTVPDYMCRRAKYNGSVTGLSRLAFEGNENVTDIVLSVNLYQLPEGCFSGCKRLERLTLPKGITQIRKGTFSGCESLTDIYYEGSPEEFSKIEVVESRHDVEFDGKCKNGTPVETKISDVLTHIPGNEPFRNANIHFYCKLPDDGAEKSLNLEGKENDG